MTAAPALELHGITQPVRCPALALDGVDFTLAPGEIHALLGENGAGKSTLMNIVCGLLPPTAGRLSVNGQPVTFASPRDAARAGIGMVHQHFLLIPSFTVAENLAVVAQDHGLAGSIMQAGRVPGYAKPWQQRLGWQIPLRTPALPICPSAPSSAWRF